MQSTATQQTDPYFIDFPQRIRRIQAEMAKVRGITDLGVAAIRDLVIHWYRAHLWKNDNADVWARDYLIKDQRLNADDAEAVTRSLLAAA